MANSLKLDSGAIEVLDPRGDLWLNISSVAKAQTSPNTSRLFLVNSRTVSHASPVFNKLIRENPKNAHKSCTPAPRAPYWVVDLYSDNILVMRILLGYMHGRPRDVPSFNFFDEHPDQFITLYRLAIWIHKYECAQAFKYLAVGWLNCLNNADIYDSGCCYFHILRETAWVSWVFGDEVAFKRSRDAAYIWYSAHRTDWNILHKLSMSACRHTEDDDVDASSALQSIPGFLVGGKLTQEHREHFSSRRKALGISERLGITSEQDETVSSTGALEF